MNPELTKIQKRLIEKMDELTASSEEGGYGFDYITPTQMEKEINIAFQQIQTEIIDKLQAKLKEQRAELQKTIDIIQDENEHMRNKLKKQEKKCNCIKLRNDEDISVCKLCGTVQLRGTDFIKIQAKLKEQEKETKNLKKILESLPPSNLFTTKRLKRCQ